ncbi:MAG: DNA polymerase III subunit alpha [Muribaculaceae bacterium]|nr:DNA polymerase III subunit alpha [Muribaculaceae bacterium]
MAQFTHLHVHSQYSLLDGKASIQELVDRSIELGMRGIALTDHGNMFGIKEMWNYVNKKNSGLPDDQKFKLIIGCEMYVAKDRLTDRRDKSDRGYHLIVLAKNLKGYKNLIKLVSKSWTDGMYFKPRTDRVELAAHKEGLIICSACLGGEVPQFILNDDLTAAEERILWYKQTFGDDYYLELQRHQTFKENSNREVYPDQCKVNDVLISLARKHGIKLVATNDVHFTYEDDAEAHDRLICVSMQKTFNEPRLHYTKQEWLKSPEEMQKIFSDLPEAGDNTMAVRGKVEPYSIDHAPIMPFFEIPKEFGTEEEYRSRITEEELYDEFTQDENGNVVLSREEGEKKIARLGGYDKLYRIKFEADYLNKLTMEGARKIYGDPLPEEVAERLNFELYIMKTMGFPGYFLIVQDFINTGRNKLGVSIGPGRGSAAGSAAAYCLGITRVDPIKYDLLFERFLNPDRISLPDIDVDFDDDGRYEVLKYVTEKYGAEKVAHIITFQTMATKSAIADVARVLEVSVPESNRLKKLVPDRLPEVNGKAPKINLKNVLKYNKDFENETHNPDPKIRDTIKYATQLEGNIRGTGIHACGVIICRDEISDWVPVSIATDSDGTKQITTQYEGSIIEDTGLIKMDFLGLKTLSIIKETLANIKASKGIDVDIDNIPLDDPATFKLYCDGRTTSTFQFESAGMRTYLRQLQPSKFEDLIAMNALYRPGPMDYIPSFIARKHGLEAIEYDIPIMEKYLKETYGVTVYQEQVMLLSRLLANFTRGESDMLRKAMGKKQIDKMQKLKVKFMAEGQKNGHKAEVLEKIWADWEKFASYAFNKSHATCYSWVAYQTGYLKANYPAEYMAGVLSRNLGAADKLKVIIDECMRMGLNVMGPDINESVEKFGVSDDGVIRFGLGAIKGVGQNAVNSIIAEREKAGPYKDIYDFVERVNLSGCNRAAIEALALAGAFDSFGIKREMLLHPMFDTTYADMLVKYGQNFQNDKNSLQLSLFGDFETIETNRPPYPEFEPWNRLRLLEEEKKLVLTYISAHPLDDYWMELTYGCNANCGNIEDKMELGASLTLGGMVTDTVTRTTKKGQPYGRVSIEDFSGKHEFVFFSRDYDNIFPRFKVGHAVFVKAQVQSRMYNQADMELKVTDVQSLDSIKGSLANSLTVYLDRNLEDKEVFDYLGSIESTPDGRSGELFLNLYDKDRQQSIRIRSRKRIALDKKVIDRLTTMSVNFKVQTEERQ